MEVLSSIEHHIYIEIKKIYLKTKLFTFILEKKDVNCLIMLHKSIRVLHYFGLGLMNKIFEYFNTITNIELQKVKQDFT